jgi:sugar phosphate permease
MKDHSHPLTPPGLPGTSSLRWVIFGVLGLQYLTAYFHRVAPAVVAPDLMKTFSLSGTSLGVLASAYFYSYGLAQIPAGILCDSWGARKTVTLFSLVTTAGVLLFGLSPSFTVAIVARALIGLGVSAVFVAAMKVLASWFKPREYGRITGALLAIGGVGWFSATTPLAFAVSEFGWRPSYVAMGFFAGTLTVLTWIWVEDEPSHGRPISFTTTAATYTRERRNAFKDLAAIMKEGHFWAIAIWFVARGGALFGFFGLWAGPFLTDIYQLSKASTGLVLSMIALAMMFMSPILGHLSDRTFESRKQVLVGTSVVNMACFLFLVIFFDSLSLLGLCVLFFVLGATSSAAGTLAIAATKEYFPAEIAGTAIGAVNVFPFIGAVLFQPLIGFLLDAAGAVRGAYPSSAYRLVVLVFAASSVIALISILFCEETLKKTGRVGDTGQ